MPYIITTTDQSSSASRQHWIDTGEYLTTHTAVATLEEARELAQIEVCRQIEGRTSAPFRRAATLPAEGGTIDQLPDGTVIAVRPTDWLELAGLAGRTLNYEGRRRAGRNQADRAALLAAFNARQ